MTDNKKNSSDGLDMLDLLVNSFADLTVAATRAHSVLELDSADHASCTSPAELSRQAQELAVSARETAANTASAYSVRGRQLDSMHAQSGALVYLTERYITQVRQRRDVIAQTQQAHAVGYVDVQAGLLAELAAHDLAASASLLESFILVVRATAHQSLSVVTRAMATTR